MRDILIKARAIIAERGLNQIGTFWSEGSIANAVPEIPATGCFCTIGAVCVAQGAFNPDSPAAKHIAKTLGVRDVDDVYEWNDDAPSAADVLALFDRAIATAPVDA